MIDQDLPEETALREAAVANLKKRRDFYGHAITFVAFNAVLIGVWWMTGHGIFFWPIFPLVFWGIGLLFHARDTFAPIASEERIWAEMQRIRRNGGSA